MKKRKRGKGEEVRLLPCVERSRGDCRQPGCRAALPSCAGSHFLCLYPPSPGPIFRDPRSWDWWRASPEAWGRAETQVLVESPDQGGATISLEEGLGSRKRPQTRMEWTRGAGTPLSHRLYNLDSLETSKATIRPMSEGQDGQAASSSASKQIRKTRPAAIAPTTGATQNNHN